VETTDQVEWAEEQILSAERENGWPAGQIGLLTIIETARGIVNLSSIAACGRRLQALCFGAEDLAGDVGMVRSREGREISYARSAVVLHAAAFDLQALDMVFVDLQDTEGLVQEAREAAGMGFAGKQIIHPNQVAPVQAAFTPGEATIAQALRIIQASNERQEEGRGVFVLDGKMVEAPMVKAARRVIARAQAAGLVSAADLEGEGRGKD
jgi:citrate lyase beta subunit